MGEYSRNTIKGHGFKVGEVFDFYGYDDAPTAQADRVVITKEGNLYVLTVTDGKFTGERVAKLGAAKKIWAAKVDTVTVAPVAQGQTVHNLETDEVFTVTEVTPATVSMRKIGTWREGVTLPARNVADMIHMGTMVIIGNPGDVRAEEPADNEPCFHCGRTDLPRRDDIVKPFPHECAGRTDLERFGILPTKADDVRTEVDEVTSHDFSNHSRRPMECRLCSRPAEVHATTTDEGSSRAMWTKARKEAGMSATNAPSANPWGPCGPCDGTDAPMARKAHPCGLMTSGSTTVAVFTEAVTAVISEGDTVGTEDFATWDSAVATVIARLHYFSRVLVKDAHVMLDVTAEQLATARRAGLITEYDEYLSVTSLAAGLLTEADRVNAYLHFNPRPTVPPINSGIAHVFVPKPEGFEGGPSFCIAPCHGHVSMPFHMPAESIGTPWRRAECVIWAGTGTLVKPAIRTGLNRRKRKATRRNRARVGGGF